MRKIFLLLFTIAAAQSLFGWGKVAHQYINKNATIHLPASMQQFIGQAQFFNDNAMDPDNRRSSSDTNFYAEQFIHFLDIDDYPNFKVWLPRNLDSLLTLYGRDRVKDNGTVPWVIKFYVDSLSAQLKRGDWNSAYQTANDLGHYVADSHVPVHATKNYNGQLSNQYGIHSRYESTMILNYQAQLSVVKDSVKYIENVLEFAIQIILKSQSLLDSVLLADKYAAPPNGYNSGSGGSLPADYYSKMWEKTQTFTKQRIQSATISVASLWYTAYVNAGLISKPANVRKEKSIKPKSFNLHQNFPNPFNPKTKIEFDIAETSSAKLDIYSVDGKLVAELVNTTLEAGSYSTEWDAQNSPSGLYFYRLNAGDFSETKKLVIVK
ncbi:MAG: T9SS type A sorting domain-containing protein [Ignavibacteriales bacterium]|nr:T9SS type A sorting domain-containing protein [Ignavibacteriales bacterium]